MLHSDKLNAMRALNTRPRVVPTFLPGDMVAVCRMMRGSGILGKRTHHRWRLRRAAREERHAWRWVEAELRRKLVNFDEFSGHRFQDITNDERPPVDEEEAADEKTVPEPSPGRQETHPTGGRRITGTRSRVAGGEW